jgi:hypothetical protein
MIGNDTPTRPNQIPLPTTSPEFQNAHLEVARIDVLIIVVARVGCPSGG